MGRVSVITRTKNRQILLKRAFESVLCQIFKEFVWVIVNDGGDPEPVNEIVAAAGEKGINVVVVHNPKSLGMEAASNVGIKQTNTEYIVIHDDDDSWHHLFLEKTVAFLESENGSKYGGVITHSIKVEEVMDDNSCTEWSRTPFNTHLKSIYLFDMARICQFPPISFLYRRSIYEGLGGYDEGLPVLGDWDFNLRFLLQNDIGIVCKPLAFYHIRISNKVSDYGNTVTQGVSKHVEYDAIIRNRLLRDDVKNGENGLGALVNYARELKSVNAMQTILSFLYNYYWSSILGKYFRKLLIRKKYPR